MEDAGGAAEVPGRVCGVLGPATGGGGGGVLGDGRVRGLPDSVGGGSSRCVLQGRCCAWVEEWKVEGGGGHVGGRGEKEARVGRRRGWRVWAGARSFHA